MKKAKRRCKRANSCLDLLINRKNIAKSKRSQEEMVGFVLIIILVAVIALIVLALSLRKSGEAIESKEIENFLHSSLLYTTSCYESPEIVYNLKDLIRACYEKERCMDGKESCDVLETTSKEMIERSWNIGQESVEKAYVFSVYDERNNTILDLSGGEKTSTKRGKTTYIDVEEGKIYIKMEIFY